MLTFTSIIASWDSEEYGLVGSTEFAEEYATELGDHCVACAFYTCSLSDHDASC